MAKIYYKLVKNPNNDFAIEDVPSLWRTQVETMLAADE